MNLLLGSPRNDLDSEYLRSASGIAFVHLPPSQTKGPSFLTFVSQKCSSDLFQEVVQSEVVCTAFRDASRLDPTVWKHFYSRFVEDSRSVPDNADYRELVVKYLDVGSNLRAGRLKEITLTTAPSDPTWG